MLAGNATFEADMTGLMTPRKMDIMGEPIIKGRKKHD
jgi:hypothetical protein